jgi:multidrug efflux system membrane fusion protein
LKTIMMAPGAEPKSSRIRPAWVAIALIGVVVAIGIDLLPTHQTAAQQQPGPAGPGAVPVSVAKVERQDAPIWLRGLGSVQALNTVQVRTRVDGTLQEVAVTEGQEVKKGDLLAVIDPRPYRAQLDAAIARRNQDQATLENARADLQRYTMLAQNEIASRQKLDSVKMLVNQTNAAIAADEALVAAADLNLAFCFITAPFDGRVGLRSVDPGNVVRAAEATPLFTLSQIHPIAATFTLPQDVLPTVQEAMGRGRLPVAAYGSDDRNLLDQGALLTLDNAIDAGTGTIRLKASFPNDGNRLWPGQFVNVRLLVGTDAAALTVPTAAVQHGPNGQFVFIVKPDQIVAKQDVVLLRDDGRVAVIAKGLDEGQTVVTDGQSRLTVGSRVAISDGSSRTTPATDQAGG